MIYARALTEIFHNGEDPRNGSAILQHILNRSYHSVQGHDVYIDGNGDAEGNFSVVALLDDEAVNGSLRMSMQPVGYFQYSSDSRVIPKFRYYDEGRPIQWVSGRQPPAEPLCGFEDERCGYNWKEIMTATAVAALGVVAAALAFKHYRYEQKLACLLWKIDLREVTIIPTSDNCGRAAASMHSFKMDEAFIVGFRFTATHSVLRCVWRQQYKLIGSDCVYISKSVGNTMFGEISSLPRYLLSLCPVFFSPCQQLILSSATARFLTSLLEGSFSLLRGQRNYHSSKLASSLPNVLVRCSGFQYRVLPSKKRRGSILKHSRSALARMRGGEDTHVQIRKNHSENVVEATFVTFQASCDYYENCHFNPPSSWEFDKWLQPVFFTTQVSLQPTYTS
ncbi:hypothetical protein J6590_002261 [Homalodisca vitripennis]|nr:hypothetical protein J6590_002261 [Homalodisca vitripennis]